MTSQYTDHLEEGQIGDEYVVKVDLRVEPGVVELSWLVLAVLSVGDECGVQLLPLGVDAAGETTAKQIDGHDAKDEPEDKADEKDIEDGGNRLDQSVDDHLHVKTTDEALAHWLRTDEGGSERMREGVTELVNEWIIELMNEWMNESNEWFWWMNE